MTSSGQDVGPPVSTDRTPTPLPHPRSFVPGGELGGAGEERYFPPHPEKSTSSLGELCKLLGEG